MSVADKPLSVIGKSVQKIDALDKALGRAEYVTDMVIPNMLHGKLLLSPHAHAKIKNIDAREAEALPGVWAVVTHADVPRVPYNPGAIAGPMEECEPLDKYVLDDTVRYVGDIVAAVAAESEDIAEEALQLIRVDYEPLPAVLDPEEAIKPGAPQIHPRISAMNLATPDGKPIEYVVGDVEKGFREADFVFEGTYKTSKQCHVTPEPSACIASYDRLQGKLTFWATTQVPFQIRKILACALGLPLGKIRCIMLNLGCGFGSRQECTDLFPVTAALAMKAGKPVKVVYTRAEEFVVSRTRHPASVTLRTGLKKDGTITAMQGRVVSDGGAYSSHSVSVNTFLTWMLTFYKSPNTHFQVLPVYTNKPVSAAFRGYGNPQARFATEVHMDEICEKFGFDPIEFKLKNASQSGDIFVPKWIDLEIKSCGLGECLAKSAEAIDWNRRKDPDYHGTGIKRKGMGMSASFHVSGARYLLSEHASAVVKLNEDGTVLLNSGTADLGGGTRTTLAQIAAETLGVRYEDVIVANGMTVDTDLSPLDVGTYGSRATYVAGGAVKAACEDAKQQLLKLAADRLEAGAEDLEIAEGNVYVKGAPGRYIRIADLIMKANWAYAGSLDIIGKASHEPEQAPPYVACFAEVEVDTETGEVKVLKLVNAHDVGRAVNPAHCIGQSLGGASQGLGYAFTEDLMFDPSIGNALNPNLLDYRLFSATDMPKTEVILVESNEPTGPFGAKGLGEMAMVPTAPAISNAIYDAVGVRIKELPITSAKVLKALREKE